ncbi:class I SAM-dependent methyltransferase [Cytophagaceae bacterium ABcell3]|nr:class I SAM-dependent methyltransferase [Cytophagaceae bacterium ABcell3]
MREGENYWGNLSKRIISPTEVKNKRVDTTDLELDFLSPFLHQHFELLDIGSGTGLIINKLVDRVKSITAVEKFEGFTRFINCHPNMLVINADLYGFKIRKEFDIALCFGVAQYFVREDMAEIYKNIHSMVKPGGLFFVRMHCGLTEDVCVDGYSTELECQFFAQYRQVDSEMALLQASGFSNIQCFDIYPDTFNVWPNTRHFLFVCSKA